MPRSLILNVLLFFTIMVGTACELDREQDPQVVVSRVDGVVHVQFPAQAPTGTPRWVLRESYNTAMAGTGLELFRVTAARFLDDGSLAVVNSGSREILFLDLQGAVRDRFGRAGSGPGEFSMMTALDVDGSGNLIVYDPREVRLTRVTPTAELVTTERLSSDDAAVDLYPLTELADGRIMAVFGAVRVFATSGVSRDTVPLVRVDPSGGPWDTLGVWPAAEWANFEFPGGVTRAGVGFGRGLAYAGRGGQVVVGSTDSLDLHVFDDVGRVSLRIIGLGADVEVPTADVERWRNDLLDQRSQSSEAILRWLRQAPHRTTYPAFEDLLLDDRGRVWIGMYPSAGGSQEWLIVDDTGRLSGELSVPSGSRLLDVAGRQVAMLRRSDLGEEYVVVMQIEEPQ